MADGQDFFDDKTSKADDTEDVSEDKVSVGDKQYTQEELSQLVELGEIGKQAEEKFNTKIDRVWPEFSKTKNELKEVQEELEGLKEQRQTPSLPENEQEAQRQAIEAAKKLGIVTKEDFKDLLSENYREFYQRERSAEKLLDTSESLSKKYDGTDGRPAFETETVLGFMQEKGITDPELAYKVMNEQALDTWKEKQLKSAKKPGLMTENTSTAGSKRPEMVKPTQENLNRLIQEQMESLQ